MVLMKANGNRTVLTLSPGLSPIFKTPQVFKSCKMACDGNDVNRGKMSVWQIKQTM